MFFDVLLVLPRIQDPLMSFEVLHLVALQKQNRNNRTRMSYKKKTTTCRIVSTYRPSTVDFHFCCPDLHERTEVRKYTHANDNYANAYEV